MTPTTTPTTRAHSGMLFIIRAAACLALLTSLSACDIGRDHDPSSHPVDCSLITNSTSDCLIGAAFADCPGPGSPAAFCSLSGRCIWVSNGCPLADWKRPFPPDCETSPSDPVELFPSMASFIFAYGNKPWTRSRSMSLTVRVDSALQVPAPAISCAPCTGQCDTPKTPCGTTNSRVMRTSPGTLLIHYLTDAFAGWYLLIEVDPTSSPIAARACRMQFTDAITCTPNEPVCAKSGQITLSASPSSANWNTLHATFQFVFPDGMTITGQSSPTGK